MYRLLILIGFALTSCAPAYVSNSRNVPLFGEANEFAGSVVLSSGVDVQTAYSVTDHVAIMANGTVIPKNLTTPDGVSFKKDHYFGEAGLGYFTRSKPFRFELFAGYGMGQGNSFESFYFFGKTEVIAKGQFRRIFIQPSVGTNNKKFNLLFTARVSMVNFTNFSTGNPAAVTASIKPTEDFSTFIEPSLTARFHLVGNLRGFFQLNMNAPVGDVYFSHVPLQGALGIQIHTGQLRTRVY